MSKEKQIEELSEILRKVCDAAPNGKCISKLCCACRAETVIRAGYRKQSEGEWVTKGDFFKTYHCSLCNYSVDYHWQRTSYCPRCGAKMGGGAE